MAVMSKVPFWLKCIFPVLFLLDWLRRYIHFQYIVLDCGNYHNVNRELYQPFYEDIRQSIAQSSKGKQPVVVEFGCGPYPALEAYPAGTHLICIEPCPDFDKQFQEYWQNSHLASTGKVTVHHCKLEDIDPSLLPDNSVDAAFSRTANCSLSNMEASFRSIRRFLKPGSRYFFWDHVLSNDSLSLKIVQYILSFPIITFFSDCSCIREPWKQMKAVGFKEVKVNRFKVPLEGYTGWPFTPTANGYAEK